MWGFLHVSTFVFCCHYSYSYFYFVFLYDFMCVKPALTALEVEGFRVVATSRLTAQLTADCELLWGHLKLLFCIRIASVGFQRSFVVEL